MRFFLQPVASDGNGCSPVSAAAAPHPFATDCPPVATTGLRKAPFFVA
jgi:hypothetical protein